MNQPSDSTGQAGRSVHAMGLNLPVGTASIPFTFTIPEGEGDCPCAPEVDYDADCGTVTFIDSSGGCPTFTYNYTWDLCACEPGTYNLTLTATNCDSVVGTQYDTEDVFPLTMSGPTAVCINNNAQFTASPGMPNDNGFGITWSGGGAPSAYTGPTFTTQWAQPGTCTVTATYRCQGGVSATVYAIGDRSRPTKAS